MHLKLFLTGDRSFLLRGSRLHMSILQVIVTSSLLLWVILFFFRGGFWRADHLIENDIADLEVWPSVAIVIPARNEESSINTTLRSLTSQIYPGKFDITVVNDNSSDNTLEAITQIKDKTITVVNGTPPPKNWTGKLWALAQGIELSNKSNPLLDFYLFTDADVEHSPEILKSLVKKAERENLQLVSLMVMLNCTFFWEKLLIPAFVFFFQKLYPFHWINNPMKSTAGAAGGYMLLRRTALEDAGGIEVVSSEVIDDCAIGRMIKRKGSIWLGLTTKVKSLRMYSNLPEIWAMVIRTAFVQLNFSATKLLVTILGMIIIYLIPPFTLAWGLVVNDPYLFSLAFLCWTIMTIAYLPTQRLYKRPGWEALLLPVAALLYLLMTIDSARRYCSKRPPSWKGRIYV